MVTVGLSMLLCTPALALDGRYQVVMFCTSDAGDYCDQGDIKNDEFDFDDGDFTIDSFDDGIFGIGGSGDFSENGLSFNADYEVINDDLDKYEIDIKGFNLVDTLILGTMDLEYSEWDIIDYDKKDEATIYFFGTK